MRCRTATFLGRNRIAAQPRLMEARSAPSVVAIGTQTSPSMCSPRTVRGPTIPIGICAAPIRFSQCRVAARLSPQPHVGSPTPHTMGTPGMDRIEDRDVNEAARFRKCMQDQGYSAKP